ncbi:MAG TPA: GHKL domain-containing protein [Clostridiales bacterium]|nr:GHKL domain-containing protein [Clostridiales bacterium]
MKRSLLTKLIICFAFALLSMFLLLNNVGYNFINKKITDNKIEYLYKEANIISSQYMTSYYNQTITPQSLSSQLRALEAFTDVRTWFVDASGMIVVDSGNTKNATSVNINDLDADFLNKTVSRGIIFPSFFDEPTISLIQPVSNDYKVRGYVILHLAVSAIHHETLFYLDIFNIIFLMFTLVLLSVFIYLYFVTGYPLHKLNKATIEYSQSNYDYKPKIRGSIEYIKLAETLSYMANELASLEDYQKKFIANISHDFRSPLTSIKGYAEAILDGTIPYEIQEKYINIILYETERLNKLTSSLLELNNMDTRGTFLNITTFELNSLIKKIAESFEGICNEKKISFKLVFSARLIYVDADINKVQQVLYNLIDNAIKFSHSNSAISISNEIKGDKLFISVKDYGVGVPKDSLNKVWDRFYKTDASRGKNKRSTGLGLSITKEIIQAHNENISIISTEGVGTEFIFSLPISHIES